MVDQIVLQSAPKLHIGQEHFDHYKIAKLLRQEDRVFSIIGCSLPEWIHWIPKTKYHKEYKDIIGLDKGDVKIVATVNVEFK